MRKKGFTLIELLAVIVILAIIALIATPMILGVIESSKKGAAESSAYGYMEAIEQYYVNHMMTSSNEELPITIEEWNEKVSMKGNKPSKGSFVVDKKGYITGAILCINNYYVNYIGKRAKVVSSKSCDDIKMQPNKPMLLDNMIPVVYENGNWVKASDDNWYDYDTQKWANAVTVKENNRATYLNAEVGTTISMDDINLMLVWIPRYEYHIEGDYGLGGTSTTNPGEIEVNWIGGKSKKNTKDYIVHPGFTFGTTELTGFWVGKFEPSKGSNLGDDDSNNTIEIKPNAISWRNNRIATAFTASRKMELASNPYGFLQTGTEYNDDGSITNDSNSIDTHMMKNREWGAVSYLSQSKYGKYGNSIYTGVNKQVYMNNHSGYITGCSSGSPSAASSATCANTYNVEGAGTGASTTGTVYGIYDMSGGSWERVMGSYNKRSGYTQALNSGFNGILSDGSYYNSGISFPNDKYYDLYMDTNKDIACNGGKCIGDGTTETFGWYGDYIIFVSTISPWFTRGGAENSTTNAGVLAFANDYGYAYSNHTFRVVLSEE